MNKGDYWVVMRGSAVLCSMCPTEWLPLPIEPEDAGRVKRYETHTKAQLDVLRLSDAGIQSRAEYVASEH